MTARLLTWWGGVKAPGVHNSTDKRRPGSRARSRAAAPASASPEGAPSSAAPPPADASTASPSSEPSANNTNASSTSGSCDAGSPAAMPPLLPAAAVVGRWGTFLRLLALHSAQLAARVAERYQPHHAEAARARSAAQAALQEACAKLGLADVAQLQDLVNSAILAECVYKIVDHPMAKAVELLNEVSAQCPPHLVTLRTVQWAQPHVKHRFLVAEGDAALYVAFMGTKLARDLATNVDVWQEEVSLDAAMLSSDSTAEITSSGPSNSSSSTSSSGSRVPAAHRGFVQRAKSIPIEALYDEARRRGKRMVLCGHSLGGAVATLCTLRLLQQLPPSAHDSVACYSFAAPALGNAALVELVESNGWARRMKNFVNSEDPIPGLLSMRRPDDISAASSSGPSSSGGGGSGAAGGTAPAGAPDGTAEGGAGMGTAPALTSLFKPQGQANNISAAPRRRISRIASHVAVPEQQEGVGEQQAAVSAAAATAPLVVAAHGASHAALESPTAAASPPASAVAATVSALAALDTPSAPPAAAGQDAAPPSALRFELDSKAGSSGSSGRLHRSRSLSSMLAAAAPPMRAVAQGAGMAARMVAGPLAAAASAPMRVAPAYLPVGQVLYLCPDGQVTAEPPTLANSASAAAGAGSSWGSLLRWPRQQAQGRDAVPASEPSPAAPAAAAGAGVAAAAAAASSSISSNLDISNSTGSGSYEEEDNVDVAAAAANAASSQAAAAVATGNPATDSTAAAATVASASAPLRQQQQQQQRQPLFYSHRMATYRSRLSRVCMQGTPKGLLPWQPEGALQQHWPLPQRPRLPSPDDIESTELLAPAVYPLSAVASVISPLPSKSAARQPAGPGACAQPPAANGQAERTQLMTGQAPAAAAAEGARAAVSTADVSSRPRWPWQRLWQGQKGGQEGAPVELLIRVEGRGLSNVTHAWVDGLTAPGKLPAAKAKPPATGRPASSSSSTNGSGSTGKGSSSTGTARKASISSKRSASSKGTAGEAHASAAETVAPVPAAATAAEIIRQPAAPQPHASALRQQPRAPVPLVAPFSAMLSWIAVSLGWVSLLRRLQPPQSGDYLLARVKLPASAVQDAAGIPPLHLAVGESPLPSLRLAPRLSLRLHTDFAVQSVPLDIRVAADMQQGGQQPPQQQQRNVGRRLRRLLQQRPPWWAWVGDADSNRETLAQ